MESRIQFFLVYSFLIVTVLLFSYVLSPTTTAANYSNISFSSPLLSTVPSSFFLLCSFVLRSFCSSLLFLPLFSNNHSILYYISGIDPSCRSISVSQPIPIIFIPSLFFLPVPSDYCCSSIPSLASSCLLLSLQSSLPPLPHLKPSSPSPSPSLPLSLSSLSRPKMLSAPVKSAKRISSLFSLGSHNKDSSTSSPSPASPAFPRSSPEQVPHDLARPRSGSRPTRIVSQPNLDVSDSRLARSPGPNDHFNLDDPLPPPPSLLAVNQDLANSSSGPDGRPQSRGRRRSSSIRPSSAAGLFVPGGGPDSRPSTPSKRRSWIPGRARASSVDTRVPSSPQIPMSGAWIAGLDQKIVYDLDPLARGDQVCSSLVMRRWWQLRSRSPNYGTIMAIPTSISSPKTPVDLPRSRSIPPSLQNRLP